MRNVKIAVLHTNLHVPGIGELGRTLNTVDTQYKFRDAKLSWTAEGLEVSAKGRTVLVPATNVAYLEFNVPPFVADKGTTGSFGTGTYTAIPTDVE